MKTRSVRGCILVIAGFLALFAGISQADVVTLANGDRLTGTIVRKENDKLVFRTSYSGELNIRWVEVTGILSDKPQRIYLDDGRRLNGKPVMSAEGEITVEVEGEPPSGPVPVSHVRWINPSPHISGEGVKYESRFNLGAAYSSGNTDTELVHVDAEVIARTLKNRYTAGFAVNQGKTYGVKTESNSFAYLKYDRFLTPKWYAYLNGSAARDQFRDIQLRTVAGAGSGYQFIDTGSTNFSLEGGLSDVRTNFDMAPDEDYPALRWAVKFEHYLFKSKVQFFHQHETLVGIADSRNVIVRSITGLRMPIAEKIRTSLQYNLDWESDPAPGRLQTDRTVLLTLGYAF